jgi:hypothetical protein
MDFGKKFISTRPNPSQVAPLQRKKSFKRYIAAHHCALFTFISDMGHKEHCGHVLE